MRRPVTLPTALLIMGGLFWPATLMLASVFVGLAFIVRARWARVLCLVVVAVLVVDALAGVALLAEWGRNAVRPPA